MTVPPGTGGQSAAWDKDKRKPPVQSEPPAPPPPKGKKA